MHNAEQKSAAYRKIELVIDSCKSDLHFDTAIEMISNYVKLYGLQWTDGEITMLECRLDSQIDKCKVL